LLWYEGASALPVAWELEDWGAFRDYAQQIVQALEAPRFTARLMRLAPSDAARVFEVIERLKPMADPRTRWTSRIHTAGERRGDARDPRDELRRIYFDVLAAVGFELTDLPAHSLALRELSRRERAPGFRLLYGVDAARECALFVLGERLDRNYYGDSVRRAERRWLQFLEGALRAKAHAEPR
jgi:hypothetical protein